MAQLYLRGEVASIVRPVKELKDFIKINLNAGECKTLKFTINRQKLSFYNRELSCVTETRIFELMIGTASDEIKLKGKFVLFKP